MLKKCLIFICFLFIILLTCQVRDTYSLFETNSNGDVTSDLASWHIKVNGTDITELDSSSNVFELGEINWDSKNHVVPGKAVPGSVGSFDILIDPMETEVSFMYEITLDFSIVNNQKFKISSISEIGGSSLVRTGEYSYAGIATLEEINAGKIYNIKIEIIWEDDELNNNSDSYLGKNAGDANIPVMFRVSQYVLGDEIVEYNPEESDNNEVVG